MNHSMRNWIAGVLALVALVSVGGLARGTAANQPEQSSPVFSDDAQIQRLRGLLSSGSLDEEGRKSIQEKLEMAERMATQRAAHRNSDQNTAAKNLPAALIAGTPVPEQPLPEGIFEGSEGLVRPSLAQVVNMWQGQRGNATVQAFAGSYPDAPDRGLLLVIVLGTGKPRGDMQAYSAPEGTGALRIVAVEANHLLLKDAGGGSLSFDLDARVFSR